MKINGLVPFLQSALDMCLSVDFLFGLIKSRVKVFLKRGVYDFNRIFCLFLINKKAGPVLTLSANQRQLTMQI